MAQLHLIKHSQGILIPATPETSDFLQTKCKLGAVLEAEYKLVRNPAFHRRYFALLNLGFEYWEPTGGAISSNERRLILGYSKFLASHGGNESVFQISPSNILTASQKNEPEASVSANPLTPIAHG